MPPHVQISNQNFKNTEFAQPAVLNWYSRYTLSSGIFILF